MTYRSELAALVRQYGQEARVCDVIAARESFPVPDYSDRSDLIQVPASVAGTHFPCYAERGIGCPEWPDNA